MTIAIRLISGQREIWCVRWGCEATWCTHGTGASLIRSEQKSSHMGVGGIPGVTHLGLEEGILLQ